MPWVHETIFEIEGITSSSENNDVSLNKTNDLMFESGVFGVSSTEYVSGQNWLGVVYSHIGGARYEIGRAGPFGSQTAFLVPLAQGFAAGTTQLNWVGVPRPTSVDVLGTSFGVGITFGCVVTASLFNP